MGGDVRLEPLTARPGEGWHEARAQLTAEAYARSAAEARSLRSWGRLALAVVALALVPLTPLGPWLLGPLTVLDVVVLMAPAWALGAVVMWLQHHVEDRSGPGLMLALGLEVGRQAALMGVLAASGRAAESPLWLVSLWRSFSWAPRPRAQQRGVLVVWALSHLWLALVLLHRGDGGGVVMAVLVAIACVTTATMTSDSLERDLTVRAERQVLEARLSETSVVQERNRIAREVHDGVGADVMALILRLRRAAEAHPEVTPLLDRAQGIMTGLRNVVWSLRNERGTLGELCKLLDARCGVLCRGVHYQRPDAGPHALVTVSAEKALALLTLAHVVTLRALELEASAVAFVVAADEGLGLTVRVESVNESLEAGLREAVAPLAPSIVELGGHFSVAPDGPALARVSIQLPLEAAAH